jgi:hypothetical protein
LGEKLPGVESGAEALRQIVENGANQPLGLTAEFVSRMPMGVIAPFTMSGYYFKAPFELNAQGKLEITEPIKKSMGDYTKGLAVRGIRKSRCPMAGLISKFQMMMPGFHHPKIEGPADPTINPQTAGLQLLAETYLRVFKIVEASSAP